MIEYHINYIIRDETTKFDVDFCDVTRGTQTDEFGETQEVILSDVFIKKEIFDLSTIMTDEQVCLFLDERLND